MPDKNEPRLRAVPIPKVSDPAGPAADHQGPSPLGADASSANELAPMEGFDRIGRWMDQIEEIVTGISVAGVEETRSDIRELIDKLLRINAELQNIARLKKLLS